MPREKGESREVTWDPDGPPASFRHLTENRTLRLSGFRVGFSEWM